MHGIDPRESFMSRDGLETDNRWKHDVLIPFETPFNCFNFGRAKIYLARLAIRSCSPTKKPHPKFRLGPAGLALRLCRLQHEDCVTLAQWNAIFNHSWSELVPFRPAYIIFLLTRAFCFRTCPVQDSPCSHHTHEIASLPFLLARAVIDNRSSATVNTPGFHHIATSVVL